jgi:hypothetical protein
MVMTRPASANDLASARSTSKGRLGGDLILPSLHQDIEHVPVGSTARQRYCRLPLLVRNTSSRCHVSPDLGLRRRS